MIYLRGLQRVGMHFCRQWFLGLHPWDLGRWVVASVTA